MFAGKANEKIDATTCHKYPEVSQLLRGIANGDAIIHIAAQQLGIQIGGSIQLCRSMSPDAKETGPSRSVVAAGPLICTPPPCGYVRSCNALPAAEATDDGARAQPCSNPGGCPLSSGCMQCWDMAVVRALATKPCMNMLV